MDYNASLYVSIAQFIVGRWVQGSFFDVLAIAISEVTDIDC